MNWIQRLFKKSNKPKKSDKEISFTLKGEAWPTDPVEVSQWDEGWRFGVKWAWENYCIDKNGWVNCTGMCLKMCIEEFNLNPIQSCGAAEGIKSGLSQVEKAMKEVDITSIMQ